MFSRQIRTKSLRSAAILAGLGIGLMAAPMSNPAQPASGGSAPWLQCTSDGRADSIGINFVSNGGFPGLKDDRIVQALDQSGSGWVRLPIYWGWMEQQRGAINWQPIDQGLKRLAQAHLHVLATIDYPVPCWAMGNPRGCTRPLNTIPPPAEWADFVSAVVTRYKDQIHDWEIWNEPDLHMYLYRDPQERLSPKERLTAYRDNLLIPGARAIHQADPTAKVIAPAFSGIQAGGTEMGPGMGPGLRKALDLVLARPASDLVDIVSFHSYWPEDVNSKAIVVRNAMRDVGMGDKPVWITEMGLGPERLDPESRDRGPRYLHQQQANYFMNQTESAISHGNVQKVFWFALTDMLGSDRIPAENYGMIDVDGQNWTPRQHFLALQSLVQGTCGGAKPGR